MTETEQTLRQRFTAFLQAMYDWETEANRVDEEEVEKKKTLSWEDFCKQQTELRIPIIRIHHRTRAQIWRRSIHLSRLSS